jgi:hypothetical protein
VEPVAASAGKVRTAVPQSAEQESSMTRSRKMMAVLLAGLTMVPAVATLGFETADAAPRRAYVGPRGGVAVVGPRGAYVRPGYGYRGYRGPNGGAIAAGVVGGLALGAIAAGAAGAYGGPGYGYGYGAYGGASCIANQAIYDGWGNFQGYRRVYVPC